MISGFIAVFILIGSGGSNRSIQIFIGVALLGAGALIFTSVSDLVRHLEINPKFVKRVKLLLYTVTALVCLSITVPTLIDYTKGLSYATLILAFQYSLFLQIIWLNGGKNNKPKE